MVRPIYSSEGGFYGHWTSHHRHGDDFCDDHGLSDGIPSHPPALICNLGPRHGPTSATCTIRRIRSAHPAGGSPAFHQRKQLGHHEGPDVDLPTRRPRIQLPPRCRGQVQLPSQDPSTRSTTPCGTVPILQGQGPSPVASCYSPGGND